MPEISIIVPVYNTEKYLHRCIDSILAQTFTDFELILVDDGSPDRCPQICDEYAENDCRVRVIHQENSGVSKARNTALGIMTGVFVTFCDSDDYYTEDWLEVLLVAMKKHSADMVIGNYTAVSNSEEIIRKTEHETGVYVFESLTQNIEYCYNKILGNKHGWEVWTRLFRADCTLINNIRFCETCKNFAEDLGFTVEYVLHCKKIISIDHSGYQYLHREGSMMQTSKNMVKFDELNEVSHHITEKMRVMIPKASFNSDAPIFHFLIMLCQYYKVIGTPEYVHLKQYIQAINNYQYWLKMTRAIFRCKKNLVLHFGKVNTRKILLFSHYALHGNWKLFSYESAILYKWLIKE